MSDNKKIAINSLLLYIRLIITTIIGVISTRIVVHALGIEDYGLYTVVAGVVIMMAFLNTVMVSTTYRFIAYEMGKKESESVNKIFNISFVIHIGLALFVFVIAETAGVWYINNYLNVKPEQVDNALFVFHFSVIAIIFSILSVPFQGLITALERFSVRVIIEITRSLLRLLFVVSLIYYTGDKLRLYSVLMAVLALIPSLMFIIYCKTNYADFTKWVLQKDKKKYKEMASYSGWTMLGAGASIGQSQGSALIINAFFGTILNASFGIASQLNTFIKMFAQNLSQAAIPQITKSHSGGDSNRVLFLVTYISKYSFFLMLLPALPILLKTEYLLKLWLGEIPEYTVIFTQLMIVVGLLDSLKAGIPAAIHATGEIKWFQIILSSILLLGLPISCLLFKFGYSPYYIQIVYIGVSILNIIVVLILLKRLISFNIKFVIIKAYLRIFFVVIFLLPIFFLNTLFKENLFHFIVISIISVVWFLIVAYFIGLEEFEKNIINKTIKLAKNKLYK